MKVWSIVSQKGGSGKTTLALHLAIAAAKRRKVLVIDLDPQQSAERWHGIRQRITGAKDDPSIAAGPYQKLPDMLKTARKLGAELVLIDTPPKLDKAIIPSLKEATMVLVPLKGTILDLQALEDSIRPHHSRKGAQQGARHPERRADGPGQGNRYQGKHAHCEPPQARGGAGAVERTGRVQSGPEDRSRRHGDREKWHGGEGNHRALRSALGARQRRSLGRVMWSTRRYR